MAAGAFWLTVVDDFTGRVHVSKIFDTYNKADDALTAFLHNWRYETNAAFPGIARIEKLVNGEWVTVTMWRM